MFFVRLTCFCILKFIFFSYLLPPPLTKSHFDMHSSCSPGPAVSVPDRFTTAVSGHRAGQRPGQQHLSEKSGPKRKQHGWHRSQNVEQGSADQHHPQVKANKQVDSAQFFVLALQCNLCSMRSFIFSVSHDFALQERDMGSQQHLRSRISRCGSGTWTVRALKHHHTRLVSICTLTSRQ